MVVRRAGPADLVAFADVLREVAEEGRWIATEAPVDVPRRAEALGRLMEGGDVLLVVEAEDGAVVGAGGLHRTAVAGVVGLGMALRASHRGRGAGRALLDALVAHGRKARLHKIELEVFPENARAIALYERAGFQVEGLRRAHLPRKDGSRRDVLLMALILPVSQ